MGVDIRLNESVEQVYFEGRKAVGLKTRSGDQTFDSLVINADFAQAMKTLVPDRLRKSWNNKKLDRSARTCAGATWQFDAAHAPALWNSPQTGESSNPLNRSKVCETLSYCSCCRLDKRLFLNNL